MSTIVVTLLPVGQGAMNLIEIYEGAPNESPLKHLTLIDCGIDRPFPADYRDLYSHAKLSVDYVVSKMKKRHECSDDGLYLDYVLFTHRDSDHWTLFRAILEKGFNINYSLYIKNKLKAKDQLLIHAANENYHELILHYHSFFYRRSYQMLMEKENILLIADYVRQINTSNLYTDTWQIHGFQRWSDTLVLDFLNKKVSYKHIDSGNDISYTVCFQKNANAKNTTIQILSKTGMSYTTTIARAFSTEPVTFWGVSIDSLKYISDIDSSISNHLKKIIPFLEDKMFKDDLVNYTAKRIIDIFYDFTPMKPIVNQFLWGGNMDVDTESGIAKLWIISNFLAKHESIDVYAPSRFQLLDNIHLDILERIYTSQLPGIQTQIHDAAQISDAIKNNATSAVALLSVDGNDNLKFLFTGDATVHTFFHIQTEGKLKDANGAVWTAPHHGSYKTAKGMRCKTSEDETERFYFPHFLSCSRPHGMVIESGQNNRHGHPNITFYQWVKNQFERDGLKEPEHFVYVNFNDSSSKNADLKMDYTPYPIYSGVSAKDDPGNITYMVHQYTAAADAEKYQHTEIPVTEIFQSKKSLSLRGAQAKSMLLCNSKMQSIPSSKLFFHRK